MTKFKEYITEGTKTLDISKLEKMLPKIFNLEEYYIMAADISKAYGHGYSFSSAFASVIIEKLTELGLVDKAIISKTAFVNYKVDGDNNGYGSYGTPKKQYIEEYEAMLEDKDFEALIRLNIDVNETKAVKKITTLMTKKIGKIPAAKYALKKTSNAIRSSYDRGGAFKNKFREIETIWDNKSDVADIINRGKNRKDNTLFSYIDSI